MPFDLHISEDSPLGQVIQSLVSEQNLTPEEALMRIVGDGLGGTSEDKLAAEGKTSSRRSYASFFGVAKGRPGTHGSPEAADRYIEELRNEW